ncbi:hypothetical protein [Gudongella sp. DL1XJH-153]|uniref:hypothetical protein n=1 Tax=Gudongella sp. DL1XJH-153 TaxID=3409804 RepID=UPI003BB672F2
MKIGKELLSDIKEMSQTMTEKDKILLDLQLFERMIQRFDSAAGKCRECKSLLEEADEHFKEINENEGYLDRAMNRKHEDLRENMLKHLRKVHKLYRPGHFISIFVPLGIAVGVTVGLINGSLLPFSVAGTAIGYLIGVVKESSIIKQKRRI